MGGDSDNCDISKREFLVEVSGLKTPWQSRGSFRRKAVTSKPIFNDDSKPDRKGLTWKNQDGN